MDFSHREEVLSLIFLAFRETLFNFNPDCNLNSRLKYTYRTKQFKEMPFKK